MKTSRWFLASVLLVFSQLVGFFITELVFVAQIEPLMNKEIRTRYDEPATRWRSLAAESSGDFRALMDIIETETNANVHLTQFDPIAEFEGIGIDGVYFGIVEFPGVIVGLFVGDDTIIEIGPMPGTFWLTTLPIITPAIILGLLAFFVFYMIIRIELGPIKTVIDTASSGTLMTGKNVDDLVDRFKEVAWRNELLENSARSNIENQRDFLHGVAHEFRAPLARLRFAVDLEEPDRAGRVESIIEDMDTLVTEILQYSRYRHGLFDVNVDQVNLNALFRHSAESLVDGHDTELVFGPGFQTEKIFASDSNLLERCVTNLVHNAIRFARSKILIDIERNDETVSLVVEDDGPGVPPGKRELIFDAFARLDPSRDRNSGGTGLGLAIVAGIVSKLGGKASAEDSSIGGARFLISLPIYDPDDPRLVSL